MQTFEVCASCDIKEGELKDFQLSDDVKILLLRKDNKYYATGTKCTHYGAPLIKGSHCGTSVRCPWHGACFNLVTGDIEDYPGSDSIATYKTEVKDDKVVVHIDPSTAKDGKRVTNMACHNPNEDKRTFVIIGGGAAGFTAVQALRENGYKGRLVLVSEEQYLPYDRVKLSKMPDADPCKIALRSADFYEKACVELMMGKHVCQIDSSNKFISFSDKTTLNYDAVLVCTGGKPRSLKCAQPSSGVHLLRSPDDGKALVAGSKDKKVVILGAGFIGLELAATLVKNVASLHLLGRDPVPLKNAFGEKIGRLLLGLHEKNGVKYMSGVSIKEFQMDSNGALTGVILTDGNTLPADICLVAIGVEPATHCLRGGGIKIDDNGYIDVDERMATSVPGIYAAGDIVNFPLPLTVTNGVKRKTHAGHWGIAQQMGRVAAMNMLGRENSTFVSVPFFFTMIYGKGIRFSGDTTGGFGDVIVHGNMDEYKWHAYFMEKDGGDRVVAVSTMGMDPIASHFAQLLASGRQLTRSEIENDATASWTCKVNQA